MHCACVGVSSAGEYLTKRIMFAQHQFVYETVPLCVEEVACPCSAHHLHQDGPDGKQVRQKVNTTVTAFLPVHCVWYYVLLEIHLSIFSAQVTSTYFDFALATGETKKSKGCMLSNVDFNMCECIYVTKQKVYLNRLTVG